MNKVKEILDQLGVPHPNLPVHDPSKEEKLPWEDDLIAAIEELKAKNEASKAQEEE